MIEKFVPRTECVFHFPPLPWSYGIGTIWKCDYCDVRYVLTSEGWQRMPTAQ